MHHHANCSISCLAIFAWRILYLLEAFLGLPKSDYGRNENEWEVRSKQLAKHSCTCQMYSNAMSKVIMVNVVPHISILTMQYLYSNRCHSIPFQSTLFYSILFYCGLLYSKPCYCIICWILVCDIVRISWYHLGTTLQSGKYQISHSYQTAQLLQQISNIIYHTCVNVSGTRYRILSFQYHASCVTGTHCKFDN